MELGARHHDGYGAMFAWESADTGDEVTPRCASNDPYAEDVRIWCRDREIHISADILRCLPLPVTTSGCGTTALKLSQLPSSG